MSQWIARDESRLAASVRHRGLRTSVTLSHQRSQAPNLPGAQGCWLDISDDIISCMINIVRELREAAGLSQSELATRSGVAQPNIAAYESGTRRASAEMIERLRLASRPLPHQALADNRRELDALARGYGLSNVRVFGSASRGTDRPGSDLDILVTRGDGVGLLSIAAFTEAASELLGVEVDVVTDGGLSDDHEILATAVAL